MGRVIDRIGQAVTALRGGYERDAQAIEPFGEPEELAAEAPDAGELEIRSGGTTLQDPAEWLYEWLGLGKVAGVRVNRKTALGLSAYYAAARNISEDVSKIPMTVHRRRADGRGHEPARMDHPVTKLFGGMMNPELPAMIGRQVLTLSALTAHGGFAEIVFDGRGAPIELWPIPPDNVQILTPTNGAPTFYRVWQRPGGNGKHVDLPAERMFHLRSPLTFDGFSGVTITAAAKDSLASYLASQQYVVSFFSQGTLASGILSHPNTLKPDAAARIEASFQKRFAGMKNAGKPIVLEEGMTFDGLSTKPVDAQLLEQLRFGVEDVARYFRIPPHKIGHLDHATFSNISEQSIEYVSDCLEGQVLRTRSEINAKLITDRRLVLVANMNAFLRSRPDERAKLYEILLKHGVMTPNEVRELEDRPPIDLEIDDPATGMKFRVADEPLLLANFRPLRAAMLPQGKAPDPAASDAAGSAPPAQDEPAARAAGLTAAAPVAEHDARQLAGRVESLALGMGPLLQAELVAVRTQEIDRAERAMKKGGINEWRRGWLLADEHRTQVVSRVEPILIASLRSLWALVADGAPPESLDLWSRRRAGEVVSDVLRQAEASITAEQRSAEVLDGGVLVARFLCDLMRQIPSVRLVDRSAPGQPIVLNVAAPAVQPAGDVRVDVHPTPVEVRVESPPPIALPAPEVRVDVHPTPPAPVEVHVEPAVAPVHVTNRNEVFVEAPEVRVENHVHAAAAASGGESIDPDGADAARIVRLRGLLLGHDASE
jgi:HK97 family phage portal protein